jgi:hypothetical protein
MVFNPVSLSCDRYYKGLKVPALLFQNRKF